MATSRSVVLEDGKGGILLDAPEDEDPGAVPAVISVMFFELIVPVPIGKLPFAPPCDWVADKAAVDTLELPVTVEGSFVDTIVADVTTDPSCRCRM